MKAGAHVSSVGASVSIVSASGEQNGSRDSWGRLPAGLVANARRRGALKARPFLSPGHRPGNGIQNEIEPCRGGIPPVHRHRAARYGAPLGLRIWGMPSTQGAALG